MRASKTTATAAVMNELFVNIKVDREERPDIDQIYMAALHHLGEQGGWPLTMFLTPDRRAVLGRHVFSEGGRATAGRPSSTSCARSRGLFREEPTKCRTEPQGADGAARRRGAQAAAWVTIGAAELNNAARARPACIDPVNGGLRGAPKFPQAALLEFLWRAGVRTRRCALFRARSILTLRADLRRRHLRSSRRRLRALLGRRALARAAFREDALRQCAASRTAGRSLARRSAEAALSRSARARPSSGCAREMRAPEGAFSRLARRRLRRRGGQVLRLVARRDRARCSAPRMRAFFARHYDVTRRRQFRGPQHPQSSQAGSAQRSATMRKAGLAVLRGKLLAARKRPHAPRPRRQGPGRLERPDDRGARQRRRSLASPHGSTMAREPSTSLPAR